jgi:hypothetical protein
MPSARTKKKPAKARDRTVIVLEGVPSKGFDWGWFSREDPRMHLQLVSRRQAKLGYKVWLERDGKRVFEPNPQLARAPRKLFLAVQERIEQERPQIEREWAAFMILQTWMALRLDGSVITVTAYPRMATRFTRTVDLAREIPGLYDPFYPMVAKEPIKAEEVTLNPDVVAIEIWPQKPKSRRMHIELPSILWQD